MWQGLKTITVYKGKLRHELTSDASLPDELNVFYARFEASNTEACTRAPAVLDACVIVERVESFKFLGVHITNDVSLSKHSKTIVKRARHNLFPLRN